MTAVLNPTVALKSRNAQKGGHAIRLPTEVHGARLWPPASELKGPGCGATRKEAYGRWGHLRRPRVEVCDDRLLSLWANADEVHIPHDVDKVDLFLLEPVYPSAQNGPSTCGHGHEFSMVGFARSMNLDGHTITITIPAHASQCKLSTLPHKIHNSHKTSPHK